MLTVQDEILAGVAGFVILVFVIAKLFPQFASPFLDMCCIAGLVIKFAADCILGIYALNWLRLINLGIGGGTNQLLFAFRLLSGAVLIPISLYFFVRWLDGSRMTDRKLLLKGVLCHLMVVATTIVIRGMILDGRCEQISASSVEYCVNCPLAKGAWVWGYTVASIAWLCICGVQAMISVPEGHEKPE